MAFTDLDATSDGGTFEGYAAVFDIEADLGDFTESIQRGAFRKAIGSSGNVPMLYDHNPTLPVLATTRGGTLQLEEDARGLRVKADVANHFIGEAVRELVKRGDIGGMSFGFIAGQGNSRVEMRDGKPHRNLLGFKRLLDVSPTWDEAYSGTEATFRSLRAMMQEEVTEETVEEQQVVDGEQPQNDDGAPPTEAAQEESVEERSGVITPAKGVLAARRRLRLMEITLPRDLREPGA